MAIDYSSADGSKTKHRRSIRRAFVNWIWPPFGDFPRELLQTKLVRLAVAGVRFAWYALLLRRLQTTTGEGVAASTVNHNLRGMADLAVARSSRLVDPAVAILEALRLKPAEMKILAIGPRTEGEIWYLVSRGFRRRNISALDLISYSPMVRLGDMHAMPYPDASFDAIVAGWVISYSDDKQRAADEIARVAKPGAIVAIGIEWGRKTPEQVAAEKTGYIVGSATRLPTAKAILDLFGDRVDDVNLSVDGQKVTGAETGDLLVIFRVR